MPDPRDDDKLTGDSHPPDLEDKGAAAEEADEVESTPGRGENQAGFLKDRDAAGG